MIDPTTKLTLLHDDNSVYADYKEQLADYLRDEVTMELNSTEDYLYIGYKKAIGSVYVELSTANTTTNTFTAEYYDNELLAWTALEITDETLGWTRSGFMFWDSQTIEATTVDSVDKYYIRLRPSDTHTATVVRGINLTFSDDAALKAEFFEIDNARLYPPGETSHINTHVASRNRIVQMLRNDDYIKQNSIGSDILKADQWDLFDVFEVKQAAVHLTLSKIFFNLSDEVDDHWWSKYREHKNEFDRMLPKARLSFDSNNDGVEDVNEVSAPIRVQRFNR